MSVDNLTSLLNKKETWKDAESLKTLFDAIQYELKKLYAGVKKRFDSKIATEGIAQEPWVKLLGSQKDRTHRFENRSAFFSFINSIMLNEAKNRVRKMKPEYFSGASLADLGKIDDHLLSLDQMLVDEQHQLVAQTAKEVLSEREHEAFQLHFVEEKPWKDVEAIVNNGKRLVGWRGRIAEAVKSAVLNRYGFSLDERR